MTYCFKSNQLEDLAKWWILFNDPFFTAGNDRRRQFGNWCGRCCAGGDWTWLERIVEFPGFVTAIQSAHLQSRRFAESNSFEVNRIDRQ